MYVLTTTLHAMKHFEIEFSDFIASRKSTKIFRHGDQNICKIIIFFSQREVVTLFLKVCIVDHRILVTRSRSTLSQTTTTASASNFLKFSVCSGKPGGIILYNIITNIYFLAGLDN